MVQCPCVVMCSLDENVNEPIVKSLSLLCEGLKEVEGSASASPQSLRTTGLCSKKLSKTVTQSPEEFFSSVPFKAGLVALGALLQVLN